MTTSAPAAGEAQPPAWLLVTGDFVHTGGMDRANLALADYLSRRGGEVHLVAFRADESLVTRKNVTFHRVAKPLNSYTIGLPLLARRARHIATQLRQQNPQILILANGGNFQSDGAINWVHYVHGAYEPAIQTTSARRWIAARRRTRELRDERRALQGARLVIANSSRTANDVRPIAPSADVRVVYYGIDDVMFAPIDEQERQRRRRELGIGNDERVAAFIGALGDRRKGFDVVFEAWARLAEISPGQVPRLLVIGSGAELPQWRQRVSAARLDRSVTFLGFRPDVPRILPVCDLLVAPTRYEAYGLGVHEALCCGVPAIVTASAGVAERYPADCRDLLLSNPPTVDELFVKINHWMKSAGEIRARIARFGAELRQISWDSMAKSIVDLAENTSIRPA